MTRRLRISSLLRLGVALGLAAGTLTEASSQYPLNVTNVEFTIDSQAGVLVARYDLIGNQADTLRVAMLVSTDAGATFSLTPRLVSGDIGAGIRPGPSKQIVWRVREDVKRLQGDAVVIKISGEVEPRATFTNPPELSDKPQTFRLRHRHGTLSLGKEHSATLQVGSRTMMFDPDPSNSKEVFVCTWGRGLIPGAMVKSVGMAHLKDDHSVEREYLEIVISDVADVEKTSKMHLRSDGADLRVVSQAVAAVIGRSVPFGKSLPFDKTALVTKMLETATGWEKVTSERTTYDVRQFVVGGNPMYYPLTYESASGGLFRQESYVNGTTSVLASDGRELWRLAPDGKKSRLGGDDAAFILASRVISGYSTLVDFLQHAEFAGRVIVAGQQAARLERRLTTGPRVWIDVEPDTGTVLRLGIGAKGQPHVETEFFDYASFEGLRMPRRVVGYVNGTPFQEHLMRGTQINVAIDPQRFKMPR